MAAWCSSVGPETTFMVVTCPLASINASMRTLPETCWLFASVGYAGGAEEISFACFTSPPTGSGAAGAEGCLLPPTRPALSASAPGSGCASLFKAMPASASPPFCVFRAALDWAEVLVSTAEFDWAEGFVCGSAFPWGGDGELATGREATEACTFDSGAGPAWTPPDCCCMYHQPPASSRTPAAIAAIRMPLLELLDPLSRVLFSSSSGSALPNVGIGSSGM